MSKRAKHQRTLCKGCKHGNEHHLAGTGACFYGHRTVTGGCLCPAFNTPKDRIPTVDVAGVVARAAEGKARILDDVGAGAVTSSSVKTTIQGHHGATAGPDLDELEAARIEMQAALDRFCMRVKRIVLRGGEASTHPPRVDAVRSRGRALPVMGEQPHRAPTVRSEEGAEVPASTEPVSRAASSSTSAPPQGEADELGKGERACLNAIVRYGSHGCPEAGLYLHTGYKDTSRATYVKALRGLDLVLTRDGRHYATDEGIQAAGDLPDLAPGTKLLERLAELGPGELAIFRAIGAYGEEGCSSALLRASVSSLKETSRLTYLKSLRAKLMVFTDDDVHRLTPPFLHSLKHLPEEMIPKKPTPAALVEMWKSALPIGEGAVFSAIVTMGAGVGIGSIMRATTYKETSARTYVKALKKRGLIVAVDGGFELAPELCG